MLTYDQYPAVISAINLIGQGRTVTAACDEVGVPIPTFENYVKNDPSLQALYVDAERRGYDAMADALVTINQVKNPVTGRDNLYAETNPAMAKVVSDNIKFLLERRNPTRYGAKATVTHEFKLDQAIIAQLQAGKKRAFDKMIEGEVVKETAPILIEAVPVDDDDYDWMN